MVKSIEWAYIYKMTSDHDLNLTFNSNPAVDGLELTGELERLRQDIKKDRDALDVSMQLADTKAELIFQYKEKAKRGAELILANAEKVKLEAINNEKLRTSLMETIGIARKLVELRDPYTAGHEQHAGDLAKAIAKEMGLDEQCQQGLMIAGYLHDIGKIIVPAEILCKPGKLTEDEYRLIKGHVQAGYDLLKTVTFPWNISRAVLEHHERIDGSGYPNSLNADQISIEGRILAVADVVEAMSAYRPYRQALGIDDALAEIERGRGVIYDKNVADACLNLFRKRSYKIDHSSLVTK